MDVPTAGELRVVHNRNSSVAESAVIQIPPPHAVETQTNGTMGKGLICVGICSLIVVISFAMMCYLMGDINPPPLKTEDTIDEHNSEDIKFENVIYGDLPRPEEQSQYGLEKIDIDNVIVTIEPAEEQESSTVKNYSIWRYSPRKVVPPIWRATRFKKTSPTYTDIYKAPSNLKIGLAKSKVKQSESLPIKGHRRSISSLKNGDDKPAFVILKVIDNSGETRIEIKIGSVKSAKSKKNRENKSPSNKSKFSMSLQTNNNEQINKHVLAKNTIISIMPNDTIVVDEYERIISEEKNKTKEIVKNEKNITNEISTEGPLLNVTNNTIHNITDYEDVLFNKSNENISIGSTETLSHTDLTYTHTVPNGNETNPSVTEDNVVPTETNKTGVVKTEPNNTFNIDEILSSINYETTTKEQEFSIIPTLTEAQTENVLNNDISNTVLDDFPGVRYSTEESKATTNISITNENVSELITTVTVQDINFTDLIGNMNLQVDSSTSPVIDLTISDVHSFDLLSKLDALSENSTLTVIESISEDDNISAPVKEATSKRENFTFLSTNLTIQDELQMATITNVAIQNENSLVLATNQNEDLVLTSTDWTVPNENAINQSFNSTYHGPLLDIGVSQDTTTLQDPVLDQNANVKNKTGNNLVAASIV